MDCSQDSITHGPKHNNHMDSNLEISEDTIWKTFIVSLEYMTSAILFALSAHHTPNLRSCKGISQTSQGFLEHQYLLYRLLTFPFNINHAPSRKNITILQQEIHWLLTLETTCNTRFLLASPVGEKKKSCSRSLRLYWYIYQMLLPW